MGALSVDLLNFSHDAFDDFLLLFRSHGLHLFFDTLFHLCTVLGLLADGDFMTSYDQGLDVVFQVSLMEANDVLSLSRRDAKVNQPVAFVSILIVNDEPVAKSIEDHLIIVLGFALPVANHTWSERFPLGFRDVKGAWIIFEVVRTALFRVQDVFLLSEPRSILELFNN